MRRLITPGRYANVTATLALVVALTGSAYAATKIHSRDIANGGVKKADLHSNAVTSGKVANHSLRVRDFKAGSLPAGTKGDAGPTGPKGDTGPVGTTTPVAVVNVKADGTLLSEAHRAPATGASTVKHTAGSAYYYVSTPGVEYDYLDDAVACSPLTGSTVYFVGTNSAISNGIPSLAVAVRTAAGTAAEASFSCAIYDLKD